MTTEVGAAEGAAGLPRYTDRPYRPSVIDWLIAWIERLPGPVWLPYLGLTLIGAAVMFAEAVASGDPFGPQATAQYAYIFVFVYPLAAYHYLSRGARETFDSFRPATRLSDADAELLKLELATTPARPVLVLWAGAAAFAFASLFADSFQYQSSPPFYAELRVISEGLWVGPVLFVLAYLVLRQGRLVSRLHRTVEHVDLLRPEPLHAMARLTARSAIALVIVDVFAGLPLPGNEQSYLFTILVFCLPVLLIALGAFFVPLRGMNQRLVQEKRRLLDETSTRIEKASAGLHRLVDQEHGNETDAEASRLAQTRMDALTKALAGLIAERDFVKRLSTWPWDSTTLRAVLSAIALPLILFAVTRLLERVI